MLINSMYHFTPGPMNTLPNYQINNHIVYMYGMWCERSRTCVGFTRIWVQASWVDLDIGLVVLGANGGLGHHNKSLPFSCVTVIMRITFILLK